MGELQRTKGLGSAMSMGWSVSRGEQRTCLESYTRASHGIPDRAPEILTPTQDNPGKLWKWVLTGLVMLQKDLQKDSVGRCCVRM